MTNLINSKIAVVFIASFSSQTQGLSQFGNPCIGLDGSTDSCDHSNTFLYCYEGKCKCPDSHSMGSANLPMNLYAKWNKEANKCLAIVGASCGIQPGGNKMECEPGINCKMSDSFKPGTCGSSQLNNSIMSLFISIYLVFKASRLL